MPFVSGKCPNCGAELQVDSSMESGFCQYCGTQIIIREAVQRYQVSVEGNVNVANLANENSLLDYATSIMEVNSQEAEQKIKAVLEINPRSYRGWTDLIRTYNYILDSSFTDIKFLDKNERIFAEERTAVTKKYGVYIVRLERFSNYIGLFHPDKITYTRQLFRYDISVKIINSYKNCLSVATDDDKSQCQSSYQKYVVQSKKEAIEFFNSYLKEEDKIRRDKYLRKNKLSNLPDFFAETEKRSAHDNSYYLVDQLL